MSVALSEHSCGPGTLAEREYVFLGLPSLIAGYTVQPNVQAFADAVRLATKVQSIGTYPGHDPSIDLAIDLFTPINSSVLGDSITAFAIKNLERFGIDYIIYRQHIYNPEIATYWRLMEDRLTPTQNHMDHVHISFVPMASPPLPPPPPKVVQKVILTNDNAGRVLDVKGRSTDQSAPVQLWRLNGGDNQLITFEDAGDGYTVLVFEHSGKVLDMDPATGVVSQYSDVDEPQQHWKLEPVTNGMVLVNRLNGRALDVFGQATEDGANVGTWERNDGPAQVWTVTNCG